MGAKKEEDITFRIHRVTISRIEQNDKKMALGTWDDRHNFRHPYSHFFPVTGETLTEYCTQDNSLNISNAKGTFATYKSL